MPGSLFKTSDCCRCTRIKLISNLQLWPAIASRANVLTQWAPRQKWKKTSRIWIQGRLFSTPTVRSERTCVSSWPGGCVYCFIPFILFFEIIAVDDILQLCYRWNAMGCFVLDITRASSRLFFHPSASSQFFVLYLLPLQ